MEDELLESKLLYTVRYASEFLLNRLGTVVPFAAHLDRDGDQVQTYYPKDTNKQADFEELFERAVEHVRESAQSSGVGAVALATTLESGRQTGIGIQIESRSSAYFVLYPYRKGWFGKWKISEPEITSNLITERSLEGA